MPSSATVDYTAGLLRAAVDDPAAAAECRAAQRGGGPVLFDAGAGNGLPVGQHAGGEPEAGRQFDNVAVGHLQCGQQPLGQCSSAWSQHFLAEAREQPVPGRVLRTPVQERQCGTDSVWWRLERYLPDHEVRLAIPKEPAKIFAEFYTIELVKTINEAV